MFYQLRLGVEGFLPRSRSDRIIEAQKKVFEPSLISHLNNLVLNRLLYFQLKQVYIVLTIPRHYANCKILLFHTEYIASIHRQYTLNRKENFLCSLAQ